MTTSSPVPADVEPTSMADLYDDCREVSGVLAPWYSGVVRVPVPRDAMRVSIPDAAADAFDYGEYGS
jgi:hypothetical protein